jgi:hypothetical protein
VILGCRCYHIQELAEIVKSMHLQVGIITVPAGEAQGIADQMVHAGIRGIMNFAPVPLRVPAEVYVEDIDSSDAEVIPVKEEPVVTAPPALEQEEDGDLLLLVAAPWETKEPDSDVTGFVQVVDDIQIVICNPYGSQRPEITKANIVTLKGGQLYFGGRLNFDIHDKSKSYVNLDWRYTPEQRALVTAVAEKLLKEQKMLIVADGVDLRQQVAKLV